MFRWFIELFHFIMAIYEIAMGIFVLKKYSRNKKAGIRKNNTKEGIQMIIIQISDLHASSDLKFGKREKIIKEMIQVIKEKCKSEELIVFAVCGDLFNKGDFSRKKDILGIFEYIKTSMAEYNIRWNVNTLLDNFLKVEIFVICWSHVAQR